MRDYQRICILEVTEQLAATFEAHTRVLSGPLGQLTFRLRSGDDDETTEELMVAEEGMLPVQPPNLNIPRERLQSDVGSLGGSAPSADIYDLLHSSPPKQIQSPARSETDSVYRALGETFTQMGHNPLILDNTSISTPFPSQSLIEWIILR